VPVPPSAREKEECEYDDRDEDRDAEDREGVPYHARASSCGSNRLDIGAGVRSRRFG
jgi:hypothetical protein